MRTLLFWLILPLFCLAQNKNAVPEAAKYDFSKILFPQKIRIFDNPEKAEYVERPEILGIIGDDYQRLFIHFTKITQNPDAKNQYLVKGKTKVREIVREFEGTMTLVSVKTNTDRDMYPGTARSTATFQTVLFENKAETATGIFRGELSFGFIVYRGQPYYDTLYFYADGFSNNSFIGTWTGYRTGKSKKVRFGDFRIPDSGDLDIGAGEFSPDPKYFDKGWKSHSISVNGDSKQERNLGKSKKNAQWWK